MVGFIQRSSDPSQPGRALDKKKSKITPFLAGGCLTTYTKTVLSLVEHIETCVGQTNRQTDRPTC